MSEMTASRIGEPLFANSLSMQSYITGPILAPATKRAEIRRRRCIRTRPPLTAGRRKEKAPEDSPGLFCQSMIGKSMPSGYDPMGWESVFP
jgi:hypothetical protein